mgnify:CR=1 FL=1
MLIQFTLGSAMILLTVTSHGLFSASGVAALSRYVRTHGKPRTHPRAAFLVALFVLWMFLGTILAAVAWALLYIVLGAMSTFEESIYFSLVTMATVGFGDIVLDKSWRVLSAIQGANGTFLFGWSTALVFYAVQRVFAK